MSKIGSGILAVIALLFPIASFGGPTISTIQNNYSYLLPGQPNYGIAPGSLFIITGTNLASATTVSSLQSSAAPGLPTSLNGDSVSVTVNGVTTQPAFYYAIATQLALVLPSSTPVGTGTVTVTYGGATASAPIMVVQSALGLDTLYGSGAGLGVVTLNNTATVFNYNNSAAPGQTIVLWGSGLGADAADSDTTYTPTPHAINVPLQVYIGGIQASIAYQGSSGYPGLNQIDVIVPQGVQPGCAVAVVAVGGGIVGNTITIPVSPGGGVCSDPAVGRSGSQILTLGSQTTYNSVVLSLVQFLSSSGTQNTVSATLSNVQSAQNLPAGAGLVSIGSCIVQPAITAFTVLPVSVPLDLGKLSLTGPTGTQPIPAVTNPSVTGPTGVYRANLPAGSVPALGGSFTFAATGGTTPGSSVGAFTATLNLGAPLIWSNMNSITAVDRAQGIAVTWTGGSPNTYVVISGTSVSPSFSVIQSFSCFTPVTAGQFEVPGYILSALPAGSGTLVVGAQTAYQSFSATGVDYGVTFGLSESISDLPYN